MDGRDGRDRASTAAPTVCVSLFGVFEVASSDGRAIEIPSAKAKALLAYLAATPGMRHAREHLAKLLWDRSDQEHARASLRQAIASLRKSFAPYDTFYLVSEDVEIVALNPHYFSSDISDINDVAAGACERPQAETFLASLSVNAEPFEDWRQSEISKYTAMFETSPRASAQRSSPASTLASTLASMLGRSNLHVKGGLSAAAILLVGAGALIVDATPFSVRMGADEQSALHGQNILEITREAAAIKKHPALKSDIARCRYDNGETDATLGACTRIINALANDDPYKAIALTIRGTAHRWNTDHAKAAEDFSKALVIDPSYYNAHHGLGYTYYLTGRFPDALSHYQRVRDINPVHFMALYRTGEVYLKMGDYINAVDTFSRAIEENDQYAHAYYNRAKAHMALGKADDAKSDLKKAASFNSALRAEAETLYAQLSN